MGVATTDWMLEKNRKQLLLTYNQHKYEQKLTSVLINAWEKLGLLVTTAKLINIHINIYGADRIPNVYVIGFGDGSWVEKKLLSEDGKIAAHIYNDHYFYRSVICVT